MFIGCDVGFLADLFGRDDDTQVVEELDGRDGSIRVLPLVCSKWSMNDFPGRLLVQVAV